MSPENQAIFERYVPIVVELAMKARAAGEKDIAVAVFEVAQTQQTVALSGDRTKMMNDPRLIALFHENAVARVKARAACGCWVLLALSDGVTHSFEAHISAPIPCAPNTFIVRNPDGGVL